MRKRQKKVQEFQAALKVGDRVITTGGLYGQVTRVTDATIQLQIADKVGSKWLGRGRWLPGSGAGGAAGVEQSLAHAEEPSLENSRILAVTASPSRPSCRCPESAPGTRPQGGIHMVLKVKTDDALRVETETSAEQFYEALKTAKVTVGAPKCSTTPIRPRECAHAADQQIRTIGDQQLVDFDREVAGGTYTYRMRQNIQVQRRAEAVTQAIMTIDKRVNELGVSEPNVTKQGKDQIAIQLPGVKNPEAAAKVIGSTAQLGMYDLEVNLAPPSIASGSQPVATASLYSLLAGQQALVKGEDSDAWYLFDKAKRLRAGPTQSKQNEFNQPAVSFTLNGEGVTKFSRVTGANVGRFLAIILDDRVVSAPRIDGPINQPEARITGRFTPQEADDLALVLRSGALPAALTYLDQREVGPTLGRDSVRAGVMASVIGLGLVTIFMLVYYRLAGINAFVSIALNLLILLAIMSHWRRHDAAGDRRVHPDDRHGRRLERPDLRAHSGRVGRQERRAASHFRRLRPRLHHDRRHAYRLGYRGAFSVPVRHRSRSWFRDDAALRVGVERVSAVFVSRTLFEFILSQRPAGATSKVSI
jgi:preprotein translocase subunit SecD